ncbi:MAG: DUF1223 domain-containing protein [Proteobacteria bacterium]|nr:DUF1223 domain-containing protein [Pseudomonadota bacterium]MDA1354716.1 DUF1223 domain-containing protein [Pseudomonadota bacterium]
MKMRGLLISLMLAAVLLVGLDAAPSARAESGEPVIVVELYTSQGCSSCPSADAFLGELLDARTDIIALEFHVDYWDNLGWKDLFSSTESTARQRAYARTLGLSYVFTPQMVINGSSSEVGSDKIAVMTAIENARESTARQLDITVTQDRAGGLKVVLPAAAAGDVTKVGAAAATVWLVNFDRHHITEVTAGENTGRMMKNNHVVRGHRAIGTWTGAALEISLRPDQLADGGASDGCAILVQSDNFGPIIGAASLWLDGAS